MLLKKGKQMDKKKGFGKGKTNVANMAGNNNKKVDIAKHLAALGVGVEGL